MEVGLLACDCVYIQEGRGGENRKKVSKKRNVHIDGHCHSKSNPKLGQETREGTPSFTLGIEE